MRVFLNTNRSGYTPDQIAQTMTVRDLIEYLTYEFDEDDEIYFKNDDGYTYGGIHEEDFEYEE